MSAKSSTIMGTLVAGRFLMGEQMGAGSYGTVHAAWDTTTASQVALKIEPADAVVPLLTYEAKVYRYLAGRGYLGIPKVCWCGVDGPQRILAIDLLGASLESLLQMQGGRFSLEMISFLGQQLLDRLEQLHDSKFLHRDIKPQNLLMGRGANKQEVYLVDFGFAKKYHGLGGEHIPFKSNKAFTGTLDYASIKTHLGVEQSRRDDLESLGYVLLYFYLGKLPWQGMSPKELIQRKIVTPVRLLCDRCPDEFQTYLNYCLNLEFEERPDYDFLRKLLQQMQQNTIP